MALQFLPDRAARDLERQRGVMRCLGCLGEYVESLAPVLQEQGVEVSVQLLRWYGHDPVMVCDVLRMLGALLAHRRWVWGQG